MNADNNKSALDLVGKYLAGEANAEEAMQLDDWLTSPDNKKEFDRLTKLWYQLPDIQTPDPPPVPEVWATLEAKLQPVRQPVLTRLFYNYYVAAAVAGLLILLSVLWLYRDKDHSPVQQQDITWFTKAATAIARADSLPDGSIITLNSHSTLAYTSQFNKLNRDVVLKGECYFDVAHNPAKPFIISIDGLKVQVVGTSFNIRRLASPASIEVQVQSGIVKVFTTQKEITVHKGQTGTYFIPTQNLVLRDTLDINSTSYATRTFSFTDISLPAACQYLEKAFTVPIKIDAQKFAGCRLSAQFEHKPLSYILDVINATLNTTYEQQQDTIYIKGNGCQ